MDSGDLHALDVRISALEAELQRLKASAWRTWDGHPGHSMAYVCSIYHV